MTKHSWKHYAELAGFAGATLAGVLVGFGLGISSRRPPEAQPPEQKNLARQIARALDGHEDSAGQYAAFYELLAERFDGDHYETTDRAAQIAGRAAEILKLPGHLEPIVNERLNPHIGTPGPLTAQQADAAAKTLRELAAACQEVSQ